VLFKKDPSGHFLPCINAILRTTEILIAVLIVIAKNAILKDAYVATLFTPSL